MILLADKIVSNAASWGRAALAACTICWAAAASGQATTHGLTIKTIAEVETKSVAAGREVVKLSSADRVVPGDEVIYTLEVRNSGPLPITTPSVTQAVPEHMVYIADSAAGPGADISYSTDGGRTFDRPENLKVPRANGQMQPARAADYTHIRWRLKNTLKVNSVAFARFRAHVK
jgi:uncharacterized repeat protein (TIGR01451 family)